MTSTLSAIEERVLIALATVRDPELDEPITALGFVASCTVADDGRAVVRLRLPTYFCAPNFAFLMVADAFDAVSATEGVSTVDVALLDHFAGEQINAGVAARAGFVNSFAGEAVAELDQLRTDFLRKAVMAGTDVVCRPLTAEGMTPVALAALTMGEVPESAELARLRRRRAELGIPTGADAPLVIDPVTGGAVGVDALPLHLKRARLTKVGIDANTGICRGMLSHRYPEAKENSA
ncbi:MAG TPA: iron-sulfur cluster assembly protein [Pseudonocardiaceae bacterium]|jgi:metal-sulfur cluster biosynthetic enzyme